MMAGDDAIVYESTGIHRKVSDQVIPSTTYPSTSAVLRILKHTPTSHTKENVEALNYLHDCYDKNGQNRQYLNQLVDCFPLELSQTESQEPFIQTEFNRMVCDNSGDDIYRAPLDSSSNTMEGLANEIFGTYAQMYYGKSAISSVYLNEAWKDQCYDEKIGLFGCFAIVNIVDDSIWNSVHIVRIVPELGANVQDGTFNEKSISSTYNVDSSIYVSMKDKEASRSSSIAGIIQKQAAKERSFKRGDKSSHIANIGKIIEDIEFEIRSSIDSLYMQKSKDIASAALNHRDTSFEEESTPGLMHTMMLNEAILARASGRSNVMKN